MSDGSTAGVDNDRVDARVRIIEDEDEPRIVLEERGTAHLQQLSVDPAHGRRGLGAALVDVCCRQARRLGYRQLTLTTFRNVPYNAPWYARLGFLIIDEPTGVVNEHMKQDRPYDRLGPRVAMSRLLITPVVAGGRSTGR